MAIRKFTNPRALDVSPGLQDILRRNGMQAHISLNKFGEPELIVMGHDSPVLNYKLSNRQVDDLMNWGSNYHNKKAYNTFVSIVRKDFDIPQGFVTARNASGRVAMGLHGYRIGVGEYGYRGGVGIPMFRPPHRHGLGWFGDFLGWGPRHQDGWHLRRINDRVFRAGGPMVAERPDGRIKPGEMRSGAYGFYYKGDRKEASQDVIDIVNADPKIKLLQSEPRPTGQAKPLSDTITADIYFTNAKFQEVLSSHGIVVDAANKTLTIQSSVNHRDYKYSLTDEEVRQLTAAQATGKDGVSIETRLGIINDKITKEFQDFEQGITRDMLESKDMIGIGLRKDGEAYQKYETPYLEQERLLAEQKEIAEQSKRYEEARRQEMARINAEEARIKQDPNAISGRQIATLLPGKAFFNSVDGGREAVVGEIRVEQTRGGNYIMSAVINGERVTHGITEKEYNKFLAMDDEHRLKLFDKKFDEVEIHRGDGRGGDDMYAQNGYMRGPSVLTGEFRNKELTDSEILHFAQNNDQFNKLTLPWGNGTEPEGKWEVSNLAVYTTNELLERLTPEQQQEAGKGRLVDLQDKYVLTARVNGELVTKEINRLEYADFNTMGKADQLAFFSKLFNLDEGVAQRVADEKVYVTGEQLAIENARSNSVSGQDLQALNEKKGFYREGKHGREVEVGDITVEKDPHQEGKYKMTAVIDGKAISHEISQKDFDRFMAVDDMQRMKLFAKIFDEVDIKTRPGQGVNIGAAILAAVVTVGNAALMIDDIAHRPRPEFYESHMNSGHYYKPGVVHPAEVAAATFEADMQREVRQEGGIGRGI